MGPDKIYRGHVLRMGVGFVVLTALLVVGAAGAETQFTISVSTSPADLTPQPAGGGNYFYGNITTVTAQNVTGYTFQNWTENGSQVSANASYTFTVDKNRDLVAEYQPSWSYTFQTTDNAMNITVDGTPQTSPYTVLWTYGTTHNVSVPSNQTNVSGQSQYVFTDWSGSSTSTSPDISITADAGTSGTYKANYKTQHYLTVSTDPAELTLISGEGWYDPGTEATTGIAPATVGSYNFSTWEVDGIPYGPGNPISISMDAPHTATAIYTATLHQAQAPIAITILAPDNNSINKTGYVNVTVILDRPGLALLNWDGTNESMSGDGTNFYINKTGLLSGDYSLKVYANDSNDTSNASETRIVTVDREIIDTTIGNFINTSTSIVNATLGIAAPGGSVTLTIFNGTIATSNGNTLNNIVIDSIKQVNPEYALTGNDKFIGENLTLGPEGAHFSPDIQLRFNYTTGQLAAAGISASELSVKYFNSSNNKWEALATAVHGTGDSGYIIVNTSHFSNFALIGTLSTSNNKNGGSGGSSGGGSSGGGGGGGGGVTSGENYSNIEMKEKHELDIFKDQVTSYRFNDHSNPILFVNITGNVNADEISTMAEVLRNTSSLLEIQAPGIVYKNINIWVGMSGFANPKNIKEAVIISKINNSWIRDNNLKSDNIKIVVWNGSIWKQLETAEKANDSEYTYYEAKTDTFPHFAITGLKETVPTDTVPTDTQVSTMVPSGLAPKSGPAPKATDTQAVNKLPLEGIPQFEWTIILVVLLLISIIFVLYSK